MATKEDHDCQREHSPNTPEIFQMFFGSTVNSEQNSPEDQTPYRQQLDQPGDAYGFPESSVNQGGIQQLTQLHSGQRSGQPGASNSMDKGREQPQALMQRQPDTSRRKRPRQQSIPDSHPPVIRQTNPGDKLLRKREADKRYRNKIKRQKLQTEADLEKLRTDYGQLNQEYQKLKSNMEKFGAEYQKMKFDMDKFGAENGQLKEECRELKSEVEKLKAENGQLKDECQEMKSYGVELGAENRYSSRQNNDTFRSFIQGSGPSQFQDVGSSVQPSNINSFDNWSHDRSNGVDEYFTEEEIRITSHEMPENEDMQLIRSHEMPENEDMQLIPRLFSMGGHFSINIPEDWYPFSSYIPSPMTRSHEMLENEDMQLMPQPFSMGGHAFINMPEDWCTSLPYIPSPMPNFDIPFKITGGWTKIKAAIRWLSITPLKISK